MAKAAAGNSQVMGLLLDQYGDQVTVTEDVVEAAAENWKTGKEVMELLLDRYRDQVTITEDVLKAAARNCGNGKRDNEAACGPMQRSGYHYRGCTARPWLVTRRMRKELMELIFDRYGGQVIITEDILTATASNWHNGKDVIAHLLGRCGDQVTITEDVVRAAASNSGNGKEVIELLLGRYRDRVTITDRVLETAARNSGRGREVLAPPS